ncbi:MAG: transketolase [Proteobacteria bacterium]|nr:transketolase [Pseudomonadota bacterium]
MFKDLSPSFLLQMSNCIRFLSIDAIEKAQSGHPGMPMGMADVATVLFTKFLKFNAQDPLWPDRDRFVLSAGHGSMLLYSLLYLNGYKDMSLEDLKHFRELNSKTAGHPEFGFASGIETTTGPLGQGLANAVGMALAEEILRATFGSDLVNHHTYTIVGDGCLMEGISQEAISLAGHFKLSKLIVLFDDNHISIDGDTSLSTSDNTRQRFEASGWHVQQIDGHSFVEIENALQKAQENSMPSLIACRTKIAFGAPTKEGTSKAHGAPLGPDEVAKTRINLNWSSPPFEIPETLLNAWRENGIRSEITLKNWEKRCTLSPLSSDFNRRLKKELPAGWEESLVPLIAQIIKDRPKLATRQCSQKVLDHLVPIIPELIGGSADLTESNNTKAQKADVISPPNFKGQYIHYGIREHGMAALMNGLALHGGIIPFGGTFLIFSDYLRPALRLSALMGIQVIYVLTHDSIGLGEDGPTHQPIEHLSSLRMIPNLFVFRPADGVETAECWAVALKMSHAPSVLALSRQGLPTLRQDASWSPSQNLSERGAYILKDTSFKTRKITLLATGSEVSLALEAQKELEQLSIPTAVISMPCAELFDAQDPAYKESVLGKETLKISIEAGCGDSWAKYTGNFEHHIGINTFGASGKGPDVMKHFGFTSENIIKFVKHLLEKGK